MSWEEDKEKVRQATDLVALVGETVVLRQRGGEFWGCCPFHQEKSPSFKVNPSTGLWKCFGCGKGGDLYSYVMEREGLDFVGALRYLAERAGIELSDDRSGNRGPKRNRLVEALTEAEGFYAKMLMRGKGDDAGRARAYLKRRGFGSEVCKRWGLGFAPGHAALVGELRGKGFTNQELLSCDLALDRSGRLADRFFDRVMFPIHDEHGRTIAFGGRVLGDGKPKYLNSKDSSVFHKGKNLYAFDRAKESITAKGEAIVCEGYTDVIAMHEAGFTNVVATLGTALTLDHITTLQRCRISRIIFLFDGDAAGQRAAERAFLFTGETTADLRCVILPDDLDPADFLAERGEAELAAQLAANRPLVDFVFERRLSAYDLTVPGKRVAALDEMAGVLAPLKRSLLLDEYATRLADALGADVSEVKRLIRSKPQQQAPGAGQSREQPREAAPARGRGPEYAPEPACEPTPPRTDLLSVLSADERAQLAVERELLATMATEPDLFRAYADRIAGFSWSDSAHESIAWAILATPEGTSPAAAVQAATAVVDTAPQILAGGTLTGVGQMGEHEKAEFLIDTVELYSTRRKVRAIRAQLSGGDVGAEATRLFEQATTLQVHANELSKKLASTNGIGANGVG